MIQNFNFYDIYGYLLPGLALLGLLWLPFGLLTGKLPATEWTSAVVGIALAYITGHVLQNFAFKIIPSTVKDSKENSRYPSELLLDAENTTFTSEFKRRLAEQIRSSFGLEVEVESRETASGEETVAIGLGVEIDGEEITVTEVAIRSVEGASPASIGSTARDPLRNQRQDAFFLCRAALIKGKSASYAEQFEGMYALMRGLSAAAFLGAVYHLGWMSAGLVPKGFERWSWLPVMAGLALAVAASLIALLSLEPTAFLTKFKKPWWAAGFLLLAIFGLGNWLASASAMTLRQRGTYLLIAGACVLISLRCLGAYKTFAVEFPKAVYRSFYDQKKVTMDKISDIG